MSITPIHHAACGECWSGYNGEHADWCSRSTATTCAVCGRKFHNGNNGVCLLDDEAHQTINGTPTEKAA